YELAVLFGLFVVFLYGPIATIVVLAFQGPEGGLVFPMNGVSLHWFGELFRPQSIGDIWGSFDRSSALGAIVMFATVVLSFLAGLAFRQHFPGATTLFYVVIATAWLCRRSWSASASARCSKCSGSSGPGTARRSVPTSPGPCLLASSSCWRCSTDSR